MDFHIDRYGGRFARVICPIPFLWRIQQSENVHQCVGKFIACFAIGACIFTCFFSVNESKDVVTLASKIHGAGSVTGFMLFLFVPLLIGILYYKDHNRMMGTVSILSFVVALIFFALFVMSDKQEFKNTIVDNEGLWQRLNLTFMYLPMAITAVIKIAG